jgi:6-phosphofructokinase 1
MGNGRIAVLTSGGDAPGMNAAIRAATIVAASRGREVLGVERGFKGLVEGTLRPLSADEVTAIHRDGGTILGSSRCPEFYDPAVRAAARAHLARLEVSELLVIGGNGSLGGARVLTSPTELGAQPLRVVGLPASIDNDIAYSSRAIGVDTAMNTIVEAVDKIYDTASAHQRTFIVEVMGRDSGYLAVTCAIAAGADMVLFPEAGRSEDELVDGLVGAVLEVRKRAGWRKRVIAIKAEGVKISLERLKERVDGRLRELGHGNEFETRATVLGHVVRGGRPSAFDRLLASRLANAAIDALLHGEHGVMVAWAPPVDPPAEKARRSPVDPFCWLVDLDEVLAETARIGEGRNLLGHWRLSELAVAEDIFLL